MSNLSNQLHIRLAQHIFNHVRVSGLTVGHHLTEQSLQDVLGTSRPPIRAALSQLAKQGIVERRPNRGYFLTAAAFNKYSDTVVAESEDERNYLAIAADRVAGTLPDVITENELMRRYDLPRDRLRRILTRASGEGWVERRGGRGWSFRPMIDSFEAYQETFEFRRIIEPAGILGSTYAPDAEAFARLRAQQLFVIEKGFETLGYGELFDINCAFHETIGSLSGNRFLHQALVRQNQLRRLVEYRYIRNRHLVQRQCREHLAILAHLEQDDRVLAAEVVRDHLRGSRRDKANATAFGALLRTGSRASDSK